MSLLYIKCIFIHQGSVFSSFFLAFFFQIFSIFLFIFISKRHNPWDILFFIFSQFFLFPGCFSLIFLFYRPGCTFSVFYRFIWFHYNFSVFMVLIFFSRCHVFYPLFHLSGLPFSFFVNNLTFSLLSTFFIPHHHFTPFSRLSLPLPPVFIFFAHVYTTFSPFQSFFAFSQLIFIFFAFSASSIVLHPLFAIF